MGRAEQHGEGQEGGKETTAEGVRQGLGQACAYLLSERLHAWPLSAVAGAALVHAPGKRCPTIRPLPGTIALASHCLEGVLDLLPGGISRNWDSGGLRPLEWCIGCPEACPSQPVDPLGALFPGIGPMVSNVLRAKTQVRIQQPYPMAGLSRVSRLGW